jgi:hypothetical protein
MKAGEAGIVGPADVPAQPPRICSMASGFEVCAITNEADGMRAPVNLADLGLLGRG